MASPQVTHQPKRVLSPALQRAQLACVLLAVTFAVYAPVRTHPFNIIDDYGYVVDNFHIQYLNWDTVKWSFTSFHYANWDPLTWMSHALDWHFFGRDPGGHHVLSMLLHAISVVLLFWMLVQATGYVGRSFAVAGLFALHPVNVEAIAWVAERKTVLSMVFFLLSLIAYRWYTLRPAVYRYLVVTAMFVLGLMSKPQVITLPFVLLLWDYWPLGRVFVPQHPSMAAEGLQGSAALQRRVNRPAIPEVLDSAAVCSGIQNTSQKARPNASLKARTTLWLLLEKLPLLALSAGSALLTMKAQWANRTLGGVNTYSFAVRLSSVIVTYVRYLRHAFWPARLSFFYPHARSSAPAGQLVAAFLLLLLITGLALVNHRRRYFAVGWFWFLGTLVPMIGLIQLGNGAAMADRFGYLPFIGLYIAVCWGVSDWAEQWRVARVLLPATTITVLLLLALATRRQLNYWSDDLTLWTHSAEAIPDNAMAENMIGEIFLQRHEPETAIGHFRTAATMDPLFPFPRLHIGIYEEQHGHPREAIEQLQQVITLTDSAADHMPAIRTNAFANMSFAYNQLGDYANQEKYLNLAAQQREP